MFQLLDIANLLGIPLELLEINKGKIAVKVRLLSRTEPPRKRIRYATKEEAKAAHNARGAAWRAAHPEYFEKYYKTNKSKIQKVQKVYHTSVRKQKKENHGQSTTDMLRDTD